MGPTLDDVVAEWEKDVSPVGKQHTVVTNVRVGGVDEQAKQAGCMFAEVDCVPLNSDQTGSPPMEVGIVRKRITRRAAAAQSSQKLVVGRKRKPNSKVQAPSPSKAAST